MGGLIGRIQIESATVGGKPVDLVKRLSTIQTETRHGADGEFGIWLKLPARGTGELSVKGSVEWAPFTKPIVVEMSATGVIQNTDLQRLGIQVEILEKTPFRIDLAITGMAAVRKIKWCWIEDGKEVFTFIDPDQPGRVSKDRLELRLFREHADAEMRIISSSPDTLRVPFSFRCAMSN